jgi:signal transduction histidine kinase
MLSLSIFFIMMVYRYQKRMIKKQSEMYLQVLQAQEDERNVIARDIHDGLGALLGTSHLLLSQILDEELNEAAKKKNIETAVNMINESIKEARNASQSLMPDSIKRFGLKAAINDLAVLYSSRIQIKLENDCPVKLANLVEIHLYRILTELINNTLKHAKASFITLRILQVDGGMQIEYSDNGIGFDFIAKLASGEGNGLNNIKNRVKLLNGIIEQKMEDNKVIRLTFKY